MEKLQEQESASKSQGIEPVDLEIIQTDKGEQEHARKALS